MTALAHAVWWHENRQWAASPARPGAAEPPLMPTGAMGATGAAGVWAEGRAREALAECGVPLVPARAAADEDEAAAAAAEFSGPVVLKLASDELVHKSEAGGVVLDLRTEQDVRSAARRLLSLVAGSLLVSPMRTGGVELLVSIRRDVTWGPVLTVGLGGIWVEVYRDVQLAPLPVSAADVDRMLGRLRAAALLAGVRGRPPVSRAAAVAAIVSIAAAAERLGDAAEVVEVNPLWVSAERAEALDALIVWRSPGPVLERK